LGFPDSLTGGQFAAELNGPAPGSGHDQLIVTGSVDITAAELGRSGSISSVSPGEAIVLIDHQGVGPVSGKFNGLPAGTDVTINGETFRIYYDGGDGNDFGNVRDVILRNGLRATGNDPGVSVSGATGFFNDVDGVYSGNDDHGIQLVDVLASSSANTIWLDTDATGYGWFVDSSPWNDEEFDEDADDEVSGHMDALSVIFHELGHLQGFSDVDALLHPDDPMADALAAGVRRTSGPADTAADHDAALTELQGE
jgi:hypothetical protein